MCRRDRKVNHDYDKIPCEANSQFHTSCLHIINWIPNDYRTWTLAGIGICTQDLVDITVRYNHHKEWLQRPFVWRLSFEKVSFSIRGDEDYTYLMQWTSICPFLTRLYLFIRLKSSLRTIPRWNVYFLTKTSPICAQKLRKSIIWAPFKN